MASSKIVSTERIKTISTSTSASCALSIRYNFKSNRLFAFFPNISSTSFFRFLIYVLVSYDFFLLLLLLLLALCSFIVCKLFDACSKYQITTLFSWYFFSSFTICPVYQCRECRRSLRYTIRNIWMKQRKYSNNV